MCEKEMKLHLFCVSVDYNVCCYTKEEALENFENEHPNIIECIDEGEIE